MQSIKKASEAEVDKISTSTSKAGPSKQSVELSNPNNQLNPRTFDHSDDQQPMETDFCGPSLPPRFDQSAQSEHGSEPSDHHSKHSEQPERVCSSRAKILLTVYEHGSEPLDHHSEHLEQPERVCSSRAKILLTVFIFRGGSVLCPY